MGGGAGTRLFPLTKDRAKPAVPLAGKYRLVDIPISNCLHAGLKRIFVLTQFNSVSLHRHIANTYKFDMFSRGFVEILAASASPRSATAPGLPELEPGSEKFQQVVRAIATNRATLPQVWTKFAFNADTEAAILQAVADFTIQTV